MFSLQKLLEAYPDIGFLADISILADKHFLGVTLHSFSFLGSVPVSARAPTPAAAPEKELHFPHRQLIGICHFENQAQSKKPKEETSLSAVSEDISCSITFLDQTIFLKFNSSSLPSANLTLVLRSKFVQIM